VPFLLQVIGIVSLVTYVSYHNGQQAAQEFAYALTEETAARVRDRLNTYLQAPHQFLAMSRIELEQHNLPGQGLLAEDLEAFEERFWQQLQVLDWLTSVHFTHPQGSYVGVLRRPQSGADADSTLVTTLLEGSAPGTLKGYSLDRQGHSTQQVYTQNQWDPRTRPWYRTALTTPTSTWTPIYSWLGVSVTSLTAVTPIYQNGQLRGVLGVDLDLGHLDAFLADLEVPSDGQVFLMERSGALVASSAPASEASPTSAQPSGDRPQALHSQNHVIRKTTQHLIQQWGSLDQIQAAQTFTFQCDRPTADPFTPDLHYFAHVFPYQDRHGLDWLAVVVIPSHAVTASVYENIRQTVIWSGFAMLGAIALGVCTTRWIMHPLLGLRDAANRISQGEFDLVVPSTLILELRQLAFSFREMANQVQLSLYEMQALNTDLSENRANLEKLLDGVPVGVIVHHRDGSVTYLNQVAKRLLGVEEETVGQTITYDLYRSLTGDRCPDSQLPVFRALQGEPAEDAELEIRRDGRWIPVEVLATPIFANDGTISQAIVAIQDISTRKEASRVLADYNRRLEEQVQKRTLALEQEIQERQHIAIVLHQRETTLRAILRTIPDLLLRLKHDGRYIERLSDGEVKVLMRHSRPGQKMEEYLPEALAQERRVLIQQAIATGKVQMAEYQIPVDDELRDEEVRVVKTGEDEVLVIVRDISDRKRAERALQQSEAQNRAILTAIPDLMFRIHRNGTYLGYVKTSTMGNLLPDDFDPLGRHISEYLPPETTQRHLHYIDLALSTGQLQVYEQENWFGGAVQYEEVRVMPCGADEALFLIRDIGDRKRVEKELRLANLRLEQLAQTDGLTQVANRRHFDDRLHQEWQNLAPEKEPLSLILFDVDYFKHYNDFYGHQAGDLCLISIAAAARQAIRHPMDLVARYGGEEFVIILPRTDIVGAMSVAERLRNAIQNLAIPHAQSRANSVITISMGVSTLIPTLQNSPDNLLTQADQALYLAKQQGRNRVVAFPKRGDHTAFNNPY